MATSITRWFDPTKIYNFTQLQTNPINIFYILVANKLAIKWQISLAI